MPNTSGLLYNWSPIWKLIAGPRASPRGGFCHHCGQTMGSTDSQSAPSEQTRVRRFDRICDEFEAAWRAGEIPRLEDHLSQAADDLRADVFIELLSLDLDYRVERGLPASPDDYDRRFPEFQRAIGAAFDRLGSTKLRLETIGPQRPPALNLPDRLGDYELLGEIGRGGM